MGHFRGQLGLLAPCQGPESHTRHLEEILQPTQESRVLDMGELNLHCLYLKSVVSELYEIYFSNTSQR